VNDKEKIVYSRQITLPEVGEKGQEELEDTSVKYLETLQNKFVEEQEFEE